MINNPNYPLRSLGLFILPLAACLALMRSVALPNEKAPPPYNSIVIALEFVHSTEDVNNSLYLLSESDIQHLDRVNYYDFFFMIVYSSFLSLFILRLGKILDYSMIKGAAWIGLVIGVSDLLENLMMLRIISLYLDNQTDFSPFVHFLPLFTWAKWGLLAFTFAGLGVVLIQRGSFSKALSIILFLPSILLTLSFVDYFGWINRFTTSIFLGFIILLIFAVCFKNTEQE